MKTNQAKPVITDYLDYRKFMQDFYEFKKNSNSKFSHSTWAELAGFKSRSFLRLVMLSKRSLTSESIPLTAKALELNKSESNYFLNLVNYNQSTQFKSREFFLNRLMGTQVSKKITPILDSYRYLTNHMVPRLQTLLSLEGIKKDISSLAELLKTNESKVTEALESLSTLGFAQYSEAAGEWSSSVENFSIPEDLGNVALQSFHQKSLSEATEAIHLPKEIRNFNSLLLVLSPDEYREVIKEYDQFTDGLLLKYQSKDPKNKKVYQINTNLIPVSETLIREESQEQTSRAQELEITDNEKEEVSL